MAAPWTEETVRQCLFLYLSLLPLNHRLVHELASVYTEAIADIKRSVLRAIEQPVSHCSLLVCPHSVIHLSFGLFQFIFKLIGHVIPSRQSSRFVSICEYEQQNYCS